VSKLPIQNIISSYNDLNEKITQVSSTEEIVKLGKEIKKISKKYEFAKRIIEAEKAIQENEILLSDNIDDELKTEIINDNDAQTKAIESYESQLLRLLTPVDPKDDADIFLEIRAGAGGDESSLFAGEMLRSYSMMANQLGFSFEIVDASSGTVGGYKEIVIEIKSRGGGENFPYSWFKYEGGVHRVQRVPATEKQGRVHTSTISVAIMPILEENNDFKLNLDEVEIIITTSQGAGGQSVNTTYSAVAMVHKPTGIKAQCQDERSQSQNRIKCLQILTSRVFDHFEQIRLEKEAQERKDQVGTADRSEKIRTYNFPQDRLTDHRYNYNWNQLPNLMSGGIVEVVEKIKEIEAHNFIESL
jgi:peptide chain release factor 1